MSGLFITLEGGEGAGKSTQIKILANTLRNAGYPVVQTREPGGTSIAQSIRKILVEGNPDSLDAITETLLFVAARRSHIREIIKPALNEGKIVICDRYIASTIAYQGTKDISEETILTLHEKYCYGLMPDLTIVLDIPPEEGLARAHTRAANTNMKEDRFEKFDLSFHESVRQSFLDQAQRHWKKFAVIDARLAQEKIAEHIKMCVKIA